MGSNCAKWLEAVCATLIKSAGTMTAPRAREHNRPPSPPDSLPGRPSFISDRIRRRPVSHASPARGLLNRPARALAAATLLALTGALALPATAEAQTATTLVSNVGQSPDGVENDWTRELSQAFTTGTNAAGYTLTGVDIVSASSTSFTAKVCETSTSVVGRPTTACTNLTPPSSFAIGTMSFTTMAGTTLSLVKSTAYAVVVLAAEDHPEHGRVQGWNITNSDSEDTGHDDEWEIDNGFRSKYGTADSHWNRPTTAALRIAIKGYAEAAQPPEQWHSFMGAFS